MKEPAKPAAAEDGAAASARAEARPVATRIVLELLDAYDERESRGYDPYNAHGSRRADEVWRQTRRR